MENSSNVNELETFCWGTKERIIQSYKECVDILRIKAGGYSSYHYHYYQDNIMYVIEGQLNIQLEHSLVQLHKGMREFIPALRKHSFKAVTDCIVIEIIISIHLPELLRDDIIRLTERGIEQ